MSRKQTIDDVLPTMDLVNTLRGVGNQYGLQNITECRAVVVAFVDGGGNVQVSSVGLDAVGQAMLLSQALTRTITQIGVEKGATSMNQGKGSLLAH